MSETRGKILIIDDDQDVLLSARLLLKRHFSLITTVEDPRRAPSLMEEESYDVVLLDMNFTRDATSGKEGFFWLEKILEIDPAAVVILITAYGDIQLAVQAIKEGAADFILKPWENERLIATISTGLNLRKSRIEVDRLKNCQKQLNADIDSRFHEMIGRGQAMKRVFSIIEKVAGTDVNVLILGENGAGKELVARALHRRSPRFDDVFMSLDMGAISETLFESELFGHEKGAFTDAKEKRVGRFETASGGTLFLDEISNLSPPLQAKLLRALEERRIMPLGANKSLAVDIRLLCATNADIYKMMAEKLFRQDLLYRINTVEIHIPPLRDRGDDIVLLADYFTREYASKYGKQIKKVSGPAIKKLKDYHWPGNVRELRHTIERAIVLSENNVLQADDFLFPTIQKEEDPFQDLNLDRIEKMAIKKALTKFGGNITRAAKELGLTRAALYRRMDKYGL